MRTFSAPLTLLQHLANSPLDEPFLWMGPGFSAPYHECVCLDFDPIVRVDTLDETPEFLSFLEKNEGVSCGWMSYEFGLFLNGISQFHVSREFPLAWWGAPRTILVRQGSSVEVLCHDSARINQLKHWLRPTLNSHTGKREQGRFISRDFESFDLYHEAFKTAQNAIYEGECYQINLTERRSYAWPHHPAHLMERLLAVQPAHWSAFWWDGRRAILCGSPEMAVRVEYPVIEARPMKGTRPRSGVPETDRRRMLQLYRSEKERAENLMVVDMWRNELARICRPGTVRVPALFILESYETVFQMVSKILGELEAHKGPADWVKATFPSPSVTGTPKIRAMEWINRIERSPRGIYCGGMGMFWNRSVFRFNVAIRTATWMNGQGTYGVGGGIVADSKVEEEWKELDWKTQAFARALKGRETS